MLSCLVNVKIPSKRKDYSTRHRRYLNIEDDSFHSLSSSISCIRTFDSSLILVLFHFHDTEIQGSTRNPPKRCRCLYFVVTTTVVINTCIPISSHSFVPILFPSLLYSSFSYQLKQGKSFAGKGRNDRIR